MEKIDNLDRKILGILSKNAIEIEQGNIWNYTDERNNSKSNAAHDEHQPHS